ncbi:RluA family pseudouridine synthase [Pontibacter sp. BT310]|uniref:Pseudouridine synthase n=1 Tax=Pontibacter populi TaxID=890055 RepID=A0ABS6XFN7_9BACT|nr:RluA family pseudouridine synthase [Pontibacter populi]MBJ6119949.1 RluA family pseudouridine synthase [Pontibacter sp. BT310]MBR0572378.1 RluA family pseudouridine synthase [Microvirga sp. STS03]MBW3366802.1 RluA family pseudouridine synthase [Pontibacter populi]
MADYEEQDITAEDSDELYEHHRIVVDKGQALLRIDKFLMDRLANVTRNKLQEAIRAESVQVNDKPVKVSYKVKPLDVITITLAEPPRDTDIVPEDIPLTIVYEDEELLLLNKAAGMVVHPAYNNWTGTLVNALTYYLQNLPTARNGEGRPGLVHRIDKDTSGLLVIAKTEYAMAFLAKQFYNHTIERTYYALVWGIPKSDSGTITGHVGRSAKDRKVMTVYPDGSYGKHAVTHYKVLRRFKYVSLVQCNLETGRTHQIRAHMKYIGHPLFSDATYGGDKIVYGSPVGSYKAFVDNAMKLMPRQALHAKSLGFIHPVTKQELHFNSDLPEDFVAVLEKWELYENEA